jgi:hypothetical protein
MRKPKTKFTRFCDDLNALKVGDTISHSIDEALRWRAYNLAKFVGVEIKIREVPTKKGRYEVTRVA